MPMYTRLHGRLYFLWFLLCMVMVGIVWRLIDLNILSRSFLLKESKARILRVINIPTMRGMMTDRLGIPLAVSIPVHAIWVNPKLFHPSSQEWNSLASLLGVSIIDLKYLVAHHQADRQFIYLKRHCQASLVAKVRAQHIAGVFFRREYRRDYPKAAVTSHVVGMTNLDGHGQEGLELAYNGWLSGVSGKREVLKDSLGHVIQELALIKKPVQGHSLVLSLDYRLQYLALSSLRETISRYQAESGSVVILNNQTGEVLAMANMPVYDPNARPAMDTGSYRNRAVTDMFEPGSVIKPFTVAFALESGRYSLDSYIDTRPGWVKIGGYDIRDDLNYGIVSLTDLIRKSSNIAAAKILLSLKPQQYYAWLSRLGFGQKSLSGFPGESAGMLISHAIWQPSIIATLAYGYGIAVTALQLAHGYAVLANKGLDVPLTFLKTHVPPHGKRLLSEHTAQQVMQMLETVLQPGGTGTRARVSDYRVAGKTGTAYLVGPNGYQKDHYFSSFVGMAPVSAPQLVVVVVIRDPQGEHFGGLVAAPLFAKIMGGALRLLHITPDDVNHESLKVDR